MSPLLLSVKNARYKQSFLRYIEFELFSETRNMGESDDEYDRKRRDKFRGERTERSTAEFRGGGGGDRRGPSRDDWQDK
jgi:hypothetical protein